MFGIDIAIGFGEAEAAFGNVAEAAPAARPHLEHLAHQILRRAIAMFPHSAAIDVLDVGAPAFQLSDAMQQAAQNIDRLETVTTIGTMMRASFV